MYGLVFANLGLNFRHSQINLPDMGERRNFLRRCHGKVDVIVADLDNTILMKESEDRDEIFRLVEAHLLLGTKVAFASHRPADYLHAEVISNLSAGVVGWRNNFISAYLYGGVLKWQIDSWGRLFQDEGCLDYNNRQKFLSDEKEFIEEKMKLIFSEIKDFRLMTHGAQYFFYAQEGRNRFKIALDLHNALEGRFPVTILGIPLSISKATKNTAIEDIEGKNKVYLADNFSPFSNDWFVLANAKVICVNVGKTPDFTGRAINSNFDASSWLRFILIYNSLVEKGGQ